VALPRLFSMECFNELMVQNLAGAREAKSNTLH
jgi:hypothetical protein